MKKIKALFLSLLMVILIAGCQSAEEKEEKETPVKEDQTLVCTTTENEDGINYEEIISMTFKKDNLKHMKIELNTTISASDVKQNWENFKKNMNEDNQEFDKNGISFKVNVDDKNYKYNTILDIDIDNVSEEDLKEQGLDGLKEDTGTLEENKKLAENDGATCVVK